MPIKKNNCRFSLNMLFLLAGMLAISSCQKYAPTKGLTNPAYFRIFNTITNRTPLATNTPARDELATTRLLCLLIDPQGDDPSHFTKAAQVGDYLCYRPYVAAPFESFPNDNNFFHAEYPGSVRMPVGGVINGLDASRWGQITPGKHRFLFLRRLNNQNFPWPLGVTGFGDSIYRVAKDTTVDLTAGKVYTMDLVSASTTDPNPLNLLVRTERWDQDDLSDTSRIYVNFYNYLERAGDPAELDVYAQWQYVINTTSALVSEFANPDISYSQDAVFNNPAGFDSSAEVLLTRLSGKHTISAAAYASIPMPPIDSFYYNQGQALGQYRLPWDRPHLLLNFYLPGQSAATGAKPYTQIVCNEQNSQGVPQLKDPLTGVINISEDFSSLNVGSISSLYQTVTYNKIAHSYPMVCSIFLLDHYSSANILNPGMIIPCMISMQRPFEANLIQP